MQFKRLMVKVHEVRQRKKELGARAAMFAGVAALWRASVVCRNVTNNAQAVRVAAGGQVGAR